MRAGTALAPSGTVPTRAADNADDRTEAEVARSGFDGGGFFFAAAGGDGGRDGGAPSLQREGEMARRRQSTRPKDSEYRPVAILRGATP